MCGGEFAVLEGDDFCPVSQGQGPPFFIFIFCKEKPRCLIWYKFPVYQMGNDFPFPVDISKPVVIENQRTGLCHGEYMVIASGNDNTPGIIYIAPVHFHTELGFIYTPWVIGPADTDTRPPVEWIIRMMSVVSMANTNTYAYGYRRGGVIAGRRYFSCSVFRDAIMEREKLRIVSHEGQAAIGMDIAFAVNGANTGQSFAEWGVYGLILRGDDLDALAVHKTLEVLVILHRGHSVLEGHLYFLIRGGNDFLS